MMKKFADQSEVETAVASLEVACAELIAQLEQLGGSQPQAPSTGNTDLIDKLSQLTTFHTRLVFEVGQAARRNQCQTLATLPTAHIPTRATPAAPAPAQVASAPLTAAELAQTTWSQKCMLATGHSTPDEIRAAIRARDAKKERAKLTSTERILAAKGCKSLAEVAARRASSPTPITD